MFMLRFLIVLVLLNVIFAKRHEEEEDLYKSMDPSKREPSPCEICKYFATEFKSRLAETDKSKEILETGHGLEKKKRFSYLTSELRLIESLENPHICDRILEYNVHAEREGSLRYAKGMSETFQTLHGLRNKGVQVELGIPEEMWDSPSAEVSKMQRACFKLAEEYEEDIEVWYYKHQDEDIADYLCHKRYLKDKKWEDESCLSEIWTGKEKVKELLDHEKGDADHVHDDL